MSTDVGHGIEFTFDADGRYVHDFRQSTVGELDICPERGRATMAGQMPRIEKDATCIGTAVHAGIEAANIALKTGLPLMPSDIIEIALAEFVSLSELIEFRWEKYNPKKAEYLIKRSCELFWEELYHTLRPVLVEHDFGPFVVYEDEHRIVRIKGTLDMYDANEGGIDWKTSGDSRKYMRGFGGDAWKLDRWEVQPTFYCEALRQLGYYGNDGPWPFTYHAFDFGSAEPKLVTCKVARRPQDVHWAVERLKSYVEMIERDVTLWPKQDNHALCSPKWCDWWQFCKGESYIDVPWPFKP